MRITRLLAVLAFGSCLSSGFSAAEVGAAGGVAEPSPEYLAQKKQLEEMLTKRNLESFVVAFEPIGLDRIVIKDRLGNPRLFNYLAFKVRNQTGNAGLPVSQAKGYNDVLAAIAAQYEQAKVAKEGGVSLQVEAADPQDGVIVARMDSRSAERKLDLGVLAFNEHGTRIRLLDDPIGNGPQETFNFPDLGEPIQGTPTQYVRDRIEEALQQKLLTVDEIRALKLPPFDATKIGENGWPEGEVHGVFIFNHLSEYGKKLTFQVRGLSNKFREHWPDTEAGKVPNYLDARFFRRVFVLHYSYPGDEFYRDLDSYVLVKEGWEWISTFQRNAQRKTMAYSRYYLDNITTQNSDILNAPVEAEFWPEYNRIRAQQGDVPEDRRLPDLLGEIKAAP